MNIELVYDAGCPNVGATRRHLALALAAVGAAARWHEWERSQAGVPDYASRCASPTILLDGRDLLPSARVDGSCACRVYEDAAGRIHGAPSVEDLASALYAALTDSNGPTGPRT